MSSNPDEVTEASFQELGAILDEAIRRARSGRGDGILKLEAEEAWPPALRAIAALLEQALAIRRSISIEAHLDGLSLKRTATAAGIAHTTLLGWREEAQG